jgi:hypothetical protein
MLLVFIKQCDEIEFPNAVDSTQKLLLQHSTQKNELEQELQRIKTYNFFFVIFTFFIINMLRLFD